MEHPILSHEKRFERIEDLLSSSRDRIRGVEESSKSAHLRINDTSESFSKTVDKLSSRLDDREEELKSFSAIAHSIELIAYKMEEIKINTERMRDDIHNEIGEVKKEQKEVITPKLIELENRMANKIANWVEKILIGGTLVVVGYVLNEILSRIIPS